MQHIFALVLPRLLLVALLCSLGNAYGATNSTKMTFNRPMDTAQARFVIDLMSHAYAQLGYELEIIDFDHPLALAAADKGELDGQLGRIANIESRYENLLRVDFPLFKFELFMLTRCHYCSLQELSRVAIRNGYPVTEQYLHSNNFNGQIIKLESVAAQLNLLAQNQVDAVVLLDFHLQQGFHYRAEQPFARHHLQDYYSYHYVHKRHEDKIPKLLAVLQGLEASGVVAQLRKKHGL
ncbi:transporter substrate-binding domain-containing protein [Pseudoalteromonas sp. BDTF-M6]|uniref:substrate-binding periplasmic protein n=1 Tax=Pseudoalteromonas sp. BDTF-M6 TaxID=2796132 RepID=UPI001BAECFAF|nr:transporter substrate-binding domain-containing protein [Pseudoalteromonas sp. BDTF-M6]MBS3798257.1 transporter substrate-binding domain-containing protein [Pseudoalteromonas sp. BDTF-M6]